MTKKVCAVDVAAIVAIIKTHKFTYSTEKQLQDGIAQVLEEKKIPFEREKRISPKEVIDFLVGDGIGLEVKTKGSPSDVARQLLGYSGCELVKELLLVTGRRALGRLPEELLGKKITVVTLWENFL